ncbi:MAG: hypothetical protein A2W03_05990 [Candidatus Aminicenantes bacterium RBG_16_63_16]|nr:MAG: hypothetical protein A2W03_05990 [Candidatus Aminicenantes bacterium RBG_16_63_16]
MRSAITDRRGFLKIMSAGAAGAALARGRRAEAGPSEPFKISEPFHGAVLNRRTGQESAGGLKIRVTGEAPVRDNVTVNGSPASRAGNAFVSEVLLADKETDIVAAAEGGNGRREHRLRVVWDKNSRPRYRFSIDDNSFFLRDIAQKKYASLFDSFYLKMLRGLHSKYGTRFVLNLYYTTGDGFDLTKFSDRYQGEWKNNADWLRLAFHARANDPDRPYQYAEPAKLAADLDRVAEEIRRFAGEEVYSPPTVIHWGMIQPAALKPLSERGVRVLSGYFERVPTGWDINYLLDDDRSEYLARHDALMDFSSGIVFSKIDIVVNTTPVDKIAPTLEPLANDPNQAEIMDLFTHEQYFWPFYFNYIPDHPQRMDAVLRWVTERGYEPVFFHEGFLGIKD